MTISFPGSLDTLTNPAATDNEDQSGRFHDVQHADANDAIEALEAKVGIDGSTVGTSLDYKINYAPQYPDASASEDDNFSDGTFSGWTTTEQQTLTVTESLGRASMKHPGGGGAGNFSCRLKAHTFATNDWCQAAVTWAGANQNYNMFGLVITNGTTWNTSNGTLWLCDPPQSSMRRQNSNGLNADTAAGTWGFNQNPGLGEIHIRLRYEGSNTFRGYISPDGISWVDISGTWTYTLTPTHWGMALTTWGGTSPYVASFAYFKTGNG